MKNDTCVAMFAMGRRKYQAFYMPDGTWVHTQRKMKHFSSLAMSAQAYLNANNYSSRHIDNLAKVKTPMRTVPGTN